MFDAPRPANSSADPGNYIQPNLGHGLRIFWAFYWRSLLSSMLLSFLVSMGTRKFFPARTSILLAQFDGAIFYYLVAFVVMAYILRKNFRHFRVCLLSNHGGEGAEILTPTLARTLRVWWAFCWRAVIYRLVAGFVVGFPVGWIVGFLTHFLSPQQTVGLNFLVAVILDGAVGMFVIYSNILDEDISDFRVALLPRSASASSLNTAAAPVNLPNY
jgi:hypothetical protein